MRRWAGRFVWGAALVLALAGCGGEDPTPPADPGEASTSTGPTGDVTESEEPGTPAADGPRVSKGSLTLNFPQGYEPRKVGTMVVTSTGPLGEQMAVTANESMSVQTLDESAEMGADNGSWGAKPKRAGNVVVDGVEMWHFTGKDSIGWLADTYGVEFGGYDMVLQFATPLAAQEHDLVVDSVLASVRWK